MQCNANSPASRLLRSDRWHWPYQAMKLRVRVGACHVDFVSFTTLTSSDVIFNVQAGTRTLGLANGTAVPNSHQMDAGAKAGGINPKVATPAAIKMLYCQPCLPRPLDQQLHQLGPRESQQSTLRMNRRQSPSNHGLHGDSEQQDSTVKTLPAEIPANRLSQTSIPKGTCWGPSKTHPVEAQAPPRH